MRKMVRDFAQQEVAPAVERMEQEDRFPSELIGKMGELGILGIPIPEEYGGAGMDYVSYIIAIHELSKVSATLGVILSVHTSVGTFPILKFGSEEQKKHYVPKLASGEYLGAFALTEPGAGSDAASLKTRAVKDGNEYVLNGSKILLRMAVMLIRMSCLRRPIRKQEVRGFQLLSSKKIPQGLKSVSQKRKWGFMARQPFR